MKNLRKYIIASVTLVASALSFGSVAMAQDIGYNKTISGPNEKGVFTLNLEAYATGSVTVETKPSDIILVLDRSGSMNYDMAGNEFVWHGWDYERPYAQDRRINIIKEAVQGFVDNVKRSNVDAQYQDSYGGHRIAIVWFSGENVNDNSAVYTGITGLNEFQKVENLTTRKASGSGNNYQAARVIYNNDYNLLNVNPSGGTYTNKAMQQVESILAAQDSEGFAPVFPHFHRGVVGVIGPIDSRSDIYGHRHLFRPVHQMVHRLGKGIEHERLVGDEQVRQGSIDQQVSVIEEEGRTGIGELSTLSHLHGMCGVERFIDQWFDIGSLPGYCHHQQAGQEPEKKSHGIRYLG